MLTCRDHGKLIDDKAREAEFPTELLRAYKREHELRVRLATATAEDAKTHVFLLQVSVDSQDFLISPAEAHRAIWPKYPAEEHPIVVDLSAPKLPAEGEPFFTLMAQSITQAIETALSRRAGMPRIHSLSIFAIAPIPLLIHAGRCIGDIQRVDLYQRHRDTQDWKWKEEGAEAFYKIVKPDSTVESDQPVALVFSISGQVSHELVSHAVSGRPAIYEIRAQPIGRDFLQTRKHLELFSYEVRSILIALQDAHYQRKPIHVFAALPAPMAIEFGRNIKSLNTPCIRSGGTHGFAEPSAIKSLYTFRSKPLLSVAFGGMVSW